MITADIAIVGSGFGGSLLAMALRRQGRSVVMIERGRHPRFAIGESTTPLANLLLEQLCDRYDLPRVRALSQWGTWQATHPHVACGLKRGFSFLFHGQGRPFVPSPTHDQELLVAASPSDRVADTHWYRPGFDAFLVDEAIGAGVQYIDQAALDEVISEPEFVRLRGPALTVEARFVVDATGPRGFVHRALGLADPPLRWLPPTQGLYAHFRGVARWEDLTPSIGTPPFPIDDAALHHVFPGGWIWVLRFNNGVTSAGVALTGRASFAMPLSDGEAAWHRVLAHLPSVARQFAGATAVTPFMYSPRVAFRAPVVCGPRWAMLSSAAGVIDPLLSTGFPLTLLGVGRLAGILGGDGDPGARPAGMDEYARQTIAELDVTERLVAALYASFEDPPAFRALALLYFAAASYTETVHRLGHPERASGFLLANQPAFRQALDAAVTLARSGRGPDMHDELSAVVDQAVAPIDGGGWRRRDRQHWYPVDFDDLRAATGLLGATREEIDAMIRVSS